MNSRWRKGAIRYSQERTLDDARWVRESATSRHKRLERDAVTEVAFCERRHEQTGWSRGARVRKPTL